MFASSPNYPWRKPVFAALLVSVAILFTGPAAAAPNDGAALTQMLMANYVMSREGNKVVNDDPGSTTVYDTAALPKDYHSAKPGTSARKAEVIRILGVQ